MAWARDRLVCPREDPTTCDPVAIGPHVVTAPDYVNFFRLLEELGTRENLAWLPEDSGHRAGAEEGGDQKSEVSRVST